MFSANGKLLKQIDGSPMGGPISVVFPDIYMCKMEFGVVVPTKSLFYKRYVDIHMYEEIVELNLSTFLDTELIKEKGSVLTPVFNQP